MLNLKLQSQNGIHITNKNYDQGLEGISHCIFEAFEALIVRPLLGARARRINCALQRLPMVLLKKTWKTVVCS